MSVRYAQTYVDGVLPSFDKAYAYRLTEEQKDIKVGMRVLVPFGFSNRPRLAIVTEITSDEPVNSGRIKDVIRTTDTEVMFTEEMMKLAFWLKERTFCTIYEAFKTMLPAGINYKTTITYIICYDFDITKYDLDETETRVAKYMSKRYGKYIEAEKILKDLRLPADSKVLEKLCSMNILIKNLDRFKGVGDRLLKMVRLVETDRENIDFSDKQRVVYNLLKDSGALSVKEICYFTGYSQSVVGALVQRGFAEFYDKEFYRTPFEVNERDTSEINLSPKQQTVFEGLKDLLHENKSCASLLYGVTGSGKTQIFLKLIDETIKNNKSVIFMVPEISLTPQTVRIFKKRYGKRISIFHSGLSLGERVDEFKRVKKGESTIAIGTRSAIFAPLKNIGLIIMDEEHEHTYKSENTPKFHAREVAKFRCLENNALLLLASATPSVNSYAKAKNGVYKLFTLDERYGNAVLPEVIKVDLNTMPRFGETTAISERLAEELKTNYDNGHQSIILLNRRGYNSFVTCKKCQKPITCPNCSISMTYHSANGRLMCHYCGHAKNYNIVCNECGSDDLRFSGVGTQKIEEDLQNLLPGAKILRMDADTTMSKFAFEENFEKFAKGEYDVMIGTQMVAKGLDFENVTLVGIICADMQLFTDDFRSSERTFSLLTQVIGRSGRGNIKGKAIIQTFAPENEIIKFAEKQDYDSFFNFEIKLRKMMVYPPYCDLCVVNFAGGYEMDVIIASRYFLRIIKEKLASDFTSEQIIALGPVPSRIERINNKFRYRLILKCHNTKSFRKLITEVAEEYNVKCKKFSVSASIDINPETLI